MQADVPFNAANAVTPFSEPEGEVLATYAERSERLASSRFLRKPHSMRTSLTAGEDHLRRTYIPNGDNEEIEALFSLVKHFYAHKNRSNFRRTSELIRVHAKRKGTPEATRLRQVINEAKAAITFALGIQALVLEHVVDADGAPIKTFTTRMAFEDFLYGDRTHDDRERLTRVRALRPIRVHEFTAHETAVVLGRIYATFGDWIVRPLLDEPSLHPSRAERLELPRLP